MAFDVDLTTLEERNQVLGRDPNLFYDPVTGYNKDPNIFGRPNPAYAQIQWMQSTGKTETMLISSSFTRRFRNNFQGGMTYTRTLRKNDNTTGFGIQANNQFDLNGDWSQSSDFQRDTIRANGIFTPWRVTLAGPSSTDRQPHRVADRQASTSRHEPSELRPIVTRPPSSIAGRSGVTIRAQPAQRLRGLPTQGRCPRKASNCPTR